MHDFYYPYVGLENLTSARLSPHKIGLWADGQFKWTDDGSWDVSVKYEENSMVSHITMHSNDLALTLVLRDFVDIETNSFIRHIGLTNERPESRDIRLFMHQVFQISRAGRADTAIYVPDAHYLLDYKGRYSLLIGGKFSDGEVFDQFAVGNYGIEGKQGTFLDAEDGELSNNAVEHGGVDSVIRFRRQLGSNETTELDYWVIAANSQTDAERIHDHFNEIPMQNRLNYVSNHWHAWLGGGNIETPAFHRNELEHSLLIIKAHCDERGSVLASGDSSTYNYGRDYYCYCWPRDAVYALWPLIRLGHLKEAKQFLEFARDTMHPDGYLMHKYQPDRAIGSTWHPLIHGRHKELAIQEDETACVIYMIGEYYEASQDKVFVENLYRTFVAPCAGFMSRFIDEQTGLPHASYDLWEEKFLTSTYTVCTVIAGLETAAKLAELVDQPDDAVRWRHAAEGIRGNLDKLYHSEGYFVKGFLLQEDGTLHYDNTLDVSNLYGPYMYAKLPFTDNRLTSTAEKITQELLNTSPSEGAIRYENDNFFLSKHQYKGNPWIVATLWLAQYYTGSGQTDSAKRLLDWSLARQLPSGALSEQYDPENGTPLGVTPLVWSHAELVNTILDLSNKNGQ